MNVAELKDQGLSLAELELCWVALKSDENEAKAHRLQIEELIQDQYASEIKDSGTTTLSHIKITKGVTKSYDQRELKALQKKILPEAFPFKVELKEDTKGIRYVQEHLPDIWALIKTAITEKPKKAQFSVITKKESES